MSRLAIQSVLVTAAAIAGCKARLDRGAKLREDGAGAPAAENIRFQPYDGVQMNARVRLDPCIPASKNERAWVDSGENVPPASGNFAPGVTTIDTVMPAALDAGAWEVKADEALTIYSLKAMDPSPRILLDRFTNKSDHAVSWISSGPLSRALESAYAQATIKNLSRVGIIVGRKMVSARKPAAVESVPAELPATAETYDKCGDATIEREYAARDLAFVLFAKDAQFDQARKVLVKAISSAGASDAEEKALKAQIAANDVVLREIWQEDDKPVELVDVPFVGIIDAFKTNSDLGLKSTFYLAKPYAAFKALDDQDDRPAAGGATDFTAALRTASAGRFALAAAADPEKEPIQRALGALDAALKDCGARRFNQDCARMGNVSLSVVSAIPPKVLASLIKGEALSDARLQGCRKALHAGESMKKGDALCSPNGKFALDVQADDNLVVYDVSQVQTGIDREQPPKSARWASNTAASVPIATVARMEGDGNFRLLSNNDGTLFETFTAGKGPATLSMNDDGFLQVKLDADGTELWSSRSWNQLTPGTLDRETMCGTTKGRIRHALEFIEQKAAFDKMETALAFSANQTLNPDGALETGDIAAELNRLRKKASGEVVTGSTMVAELLAETSVFECIAALAGLPATDRIELADVQRALSCARRPRSTSLADRCPDGGKTTRLAPDTGTWKRLELIVPTDDSDKRWLGGQSYPEAESYCTAHQRRVPTAEELSNLLKDYAVLGADGHTLRNELFGMVFVRGVRTTPPLIDGFAVASSTRDSVKRSYVQFGPVAQANGEVKLNKDVVDPMSWLCVADRKPPLP